MPGDLQLGSGEEVEDSPGNDFKFFRARYVNPYCGEHAGHTHGFVIETEDEDETKYDEQFKQLLELV